MTSYPTGKNIANLIIAGVNKAGSTSLFYYLSAHPEVCGSKDKETCYFLPLLYDEKIGPEEEYIRQFSHCTNTRYRMEATPAYVFGGFKIASEIKNALGDVKIIIILKDPVERLISFFHRKKSTFQLPDDMDLREYVKMCLGKNHQELAKKENQIYTGISLGFYHEYLGPWLTMFGKDLTIVFFDDFIRDTRNFMINLASWLDVDTHFYNDFDFDIKNKSYNYRNRLLHKIAVTANNTGKRIWRSNPGLKKKMLDTYYKLNGSPFSKREIMEDTLQFLRDYYRPHNMVLCEMLKQHGITNIPGWMEAEKHRV